MYIYTYLPGFTIIDYKILQLVIFLYPWSLANIVNN